MSRIFGGISCALLLAVSTASAQEGYRVPAKEIVDILDAAPLPDGSVDPRGQWLLLTHKRSMPQLAELAVPSVALGGTKANPKNRGPSNPYYTQGRGFSLVRLSDGQEIRISMPEGRIAPPLWAPDGRRFVFLRVADEGVELWTAGPEQTTARRVGTSYVNFTGQPPCSWMPDSRRVVCQLVPLNAGPAPQPSPVPDAPSTQETDSAKAPVWTFANLLQSPFDEVVFDYYMTTQPTLLDVASGEQQPVGSAAIYQSFKPSPDGRYFLSSRILRPYSYLMPSDRFPRAIEILDGNGQKVKTIAQLPLDTSGVGMGWASAGPRDFVWQPDAPATVIYAQALDGGNPKQPAQYRDSLLKLPAPFTGPSVELLRTESRMGGYEAKTMFGVNGLALVEEFDWPTRRKRTWMLDANKVSKPSIVLEVITDDWYANPGAPVMTTDTRGYSLLLQDGDSIYLIGPGGSPEGDRPFVDRFNLKTRKSQRLFRSSGESYENILTVLDNKGQRILTTYETQEQPRNYYLRDLKANRRQALTSFPHPAPQLAHIKKQRIEYKRADGVPLTGELYLPTTYKEGQAVPTLVWAYPKEFASTDGAGQVRGSQYKFSWENSFSLHHLLLLTQGYAVLDDASMPIVGGLTANDTYREQLAANGKAAVDKLVELGVSRRGHIGIAGHSYGAFMAANMLANSDDFAAGIAQDGGYNRSLTPFGFQRERRTFWEAPEVYFRMSAFMQADKINEPLLLIHGEVDSNMGTWPIQSQRLFHAIKGLGGTSRLIMLPYEDHVYVSRESTLHVMAEMVDWMDRYVKNNGKDLAGSSR